METCRRCHRLVEFQLGVCPACGQRKGRRDRHTDDGTKPPGVVTWFRILNGLSLLGGIILTISLLSGISLDATDPEVSPETGETALGFTIIGFMILISLLFPILGVWCPRRPWMWVFGIVWLALTILQCCVPGIIMLIFWTKPRCRSWFHPTHFDPDSVGRVFE